MDKRTQMDLKKREKIGINITKRMIFIGFMLQFSEQLISIIPNIQIGVLNHLLTMKEY